MSSDAAPTIPAVVLRAYGFDDDDATVVHDGWDGHTWHVATDDRDLALRTATPTSDEYVAAHLDALVAADLPVPAPRRTVDGDLWVDVDDVRWIACGWIEGEHVAADDHAAAFATGELLARCHLVGDAGTPKELARRPGWSPLIDYAESSRSGDWSLRSAMVRLGQPRPGRVTVVADLMRRCDLHLHPLRRAVEAHPVVAHFDAHPGNVLGTTDGEVALLDWHFAHPDHRAADVAVTMRGWKDAAPHVLAGYESVTPLTDEEHDALPLLEVARGLDHVASRLTIWADDRHAHDLDELVEVIDREVDDLLPKMEPYPDERVDPRRGRG